MAVTYFSEDIQRDGNAQSFWELLGADTEIKEILHKGRQEMDLSGRVEWLSGKWHSATILYHSRLTDTMNLL